MAKSRTPRPLRFFVTGALLVAPVACGDTPIEDLPTHNEAPPPNVEPEQPAEEAPQVVEQEVAPSTLTGDLRLEVSANAVPPHLQPPSPLNAPTMAPTTNPQERVTETR